MLKPEAHRANVRTFYERFASTYDDNRYGTEEQKRTDEEAKSAVLDLLSDCDLSRSRVLDCGCGTGRFSQLFDSLGSEVVGVDASPGMVEVARSKVPRGTFEVRDIFNLGFTSEFDIIVCSQVLTHLHEYRIPLEGMRRALRPGGAIIVDVRNLLAPRNAVRALRNFAAKRFGRTLEYDPHFTTLAAMRRTAESVGLRLVDWRGVRGLGGAPRTSAHQQESFAATLALRLTDRG